MKKLEIRKVENQSLLERCMKIRNQVFTLEKGVSKEIEVDENDCLNERCNHFLIQYEEKDIGTIRCLHTPENTIRIQRFCFLKAYRGMGFGKTVMAYLENYYKNEGVTEIEMDAKYEVFSFYEKCGYRKISDVFIEADIEHVKMRKEI